MEIDFDTEGTADDTDRLQHKDFEMMSAAEMRHAEQAIANLQPKLPRRSARRSKLSSRGQLIAMRAALQHAERQGGMVIPKFRSVITKSRPLVILCDISGSMEHYSRIMLHFIHALTRNHPKVSRLALIRVPPDQSSTRCETDCTASSTSRCRIWRLMLVRRVPNKKLETCG